MMLAGAEGKNWNERLKNSMTALDRRVFAGHPHPRWRAGGARPVGFPPAQRWPAAHRRLGSRLGIRRAAHPGLRSHPRSQPGEIVTLSNSALSVHQALPPAPQLARCVFEHIYFSRPDSFWDGQSVHQVRQNLGRELAQEASDRRGCGHPGARFFHPGGHWLFRQSGIPYNDGFIKNRYIGRTFIQPTDSLRKQGVALKFNVIVENVFGKAGGHDR